MSACCRCNHISFRLTFLCTHSCLISSCDSTHALFQDVQRQVRFRDLCQAGEDLGLILVCLPVHCKLPAFIPFCGLQYPEFSSDGVLRLGNLVPDFSAGRSLQFWNSRLFTGRCSSRERCFLKSNSTTFATQQVILTCSVPFCRHNYGTHEELSRVD